MLGYLKRSRLVRVLAALFFIVPLTFATSASANAAGLVPTVLSTGSNQTEGRTVNFGDGIKGIADTTCAWTHRISGAEYQVLAGGYCAALSIPFPGCDWLDAECTTVTVTLKGARSGSTELVEVDVPITIMQDDDAGFSTNKVNWYLSTATLPAGFDPSEVCVTVTNSASRFQQDPMVACELTMLAAPVASACATFDLRKFIVRAPYAFDIWGDNWAHTMQQKFDFTYSATKATWVYVVFKATPAGVSAGVENGLGSTLVRPATTVPMLLQPTGGQVVTSTLTVELTGRVDGPPKIEPVWWTPVGMGSVQSENGDDWGGWYGVLASASGRGTIGKNVPGDCKMYEGAKLYNDTRNTFDEPAGPLESDPEDDPVSETPVYEDPTPDPGTESGFWRGVLAALRLILNAIWDIPAELVKALFNGLTSFVVPSPEFFKEQAVDLKDSTDGTTLGNYWDEIGTAVQPPNGGSGCEGPAVKLNPFGSTGAASHPLSACTGSMANLAGYSRLALSVSFALFGGIACLRVLGKSFGWDPGLGSGGASA